LSEEGAKATYIGPVTKDMQTPNGGRRLREGEIAVFFQGGKDSTSQRMLRHIKANEVIPGGRLGRIIQPGEIKPGGIGDRSGPGEGGNLSKREERLGIFSASLLPFLLSTWFWIENLRSD